MNHFLHIFLSAILLLGCAGKSETIPCQNKSSKVRWNNEKSDTAIIKNILSKYPKENTGDHGKLIVKIAQEWIDTPYIGHTLEGEKENITVNTSGLDCVTFVETVMALYQTIQSESIKIDDYVSRLENIRYRSGKCEDYASRLHYNSDWARDNINRGNIIDVTPTLPNHRTLSRSLNFMTTHPESYPSLSDSTQYRKVKEVESTLKNHSFPYIPTAALSNPALTSKLKDGDITAFVFNRSDLDIAHLGFVIFKNGKPYVLHASSSAGKVMISKKPLSEFAKRNSKWIGVRFYRIK